MAIRTQSPYQQKTRSLVSTQPRAAHSANPSGLPDNRHPLTISNTTPSDISRSSSAPGPPSKFVGISSQYKPVPTVASYPQYSSVQTQKSSNGSAPKGSLPSPQGSPFRRNRSPPLIPNIQGPSSSSNGGVRSAVGGRSLRPNLHPSLPPGQAPSKNPDTMLQNLLMNNGWKCLGQGYPAQLTDHLIPPSIPPSLPCDIHCLVQFISSTGIIICNH